MPLAQRLTPLLILLASALHCAAEDPISRTRVLMGTYVTLTAPAKNNLQITQAFQQIARIEKALSSFDPEASISKLNQTHTVASHPFLVEAIHKSLAYYQHTQGFFDITIGSISKDLYHFGEAKTYHPTPTQLQGAARNIHGIHLLEERIQTDQNITIDLGGMGKGYAVDKVAAYFQEHNITQASIALSGDIRCLGSCTLYLQSPYSERTFAKITSQTKTLAISTSGTYRRYAQTPQAHHLINPKTATQGRDFVSVSLFAKDDNSKLDAYATAISVMPKAKAIAFLQSQEDIGFIVVDANATILYGNLGKLLDYEFLGKSEKNTKKSISDNATAKPSNAKSLTHPDTTKPVMIKP